MQKPPKNLRKPTGVIGIRRMNLRSNAMPQTITCSACKKAKPESDFTLQKNGFWQKRCQTCAKRQKRYYYKRKAEKYLTPSEVNKFPPMPEILKPAYWHKYS